jgi:hypothetical protein
MNQIEYLSMLCEKREVSQGVLDVLAAVKAGKAEWFQVSKAIDAAKVAPWKSNKSEAATPGYYLMENTPYVVTLSKESGRAYAKKLTSTGWVFVPGAVFRLQADNKMTVDQARAYGKLHGRCAICGKELSDPKSVSQGIGPVCIKRLDR